jgi:hypothetical protein
VSTIEYSTPPELVCFDVRLEQGVLMGSISVRDALQVINYFCSIGWVSPEERDELLAGLGVI